ncbi:Y-family DNA polymerase [Haloplasma contractile]|uniref:ImpB-mucB-samB family protein n=1 Tax=Haloplasma contractile SSD-17B TaxID=1033810 RepID=U2FMG1_9MOLU|nr:type VI secretion protein ImpB [Haloplasma contractile]ERJ12354.1 ImpB-mucB-samB family protein [Haloplasma contractile SSD-17B]
MVQYPKKRNILCIDLRSFYASCECVLRGLDPMNVKLAVIGNLKRPGSICLAQTPPLKKVTGTSRCRLFEIPKLDDLLLVPARMKKYLEISQSIVRVILKYVPNEDLHIYSIDESFLDVTETMHLFAESEEELATIIMDDILSETGIPSACGIGPNMLLAKLALDNEAKKNKNGIAHFTYENVKEKLWPIAPLSKMWGIGKRLEQTLNNMGIYKVGDIAKYDINKLSKKLGIIGEELYHHSHGIDFSIISEPHKCKEKNYGIGQTLFKDYFYNVKVVMLEQLEELGMRIRMKQKVGRTLHLSIGYSKETGGGFSRQITLNEPTNLTDEMYTACEKIFDKYYDGRPIRRISVSIGNLSDDSHTQLDLFKNRLKDKRLAYAMDEIRHKFGKNALLRATSYQKEGTARVRNKLIGGHYKDIEDHPDYRAT